MDWLDLLAVQGTLKSLLQHHSSKASILQHSAFFIVQLSHPYMTTGKTIALTRWTCVGKVMSLLFNMLSRLVITFLLRSKRLLVSWLQSPSAVILEPKSIKSVTASTFSPSICHEAMGLSKWHPFSHFKCLIMSNSWRAHGLQHARLPCPSPTPGACLNSCPSVLPSNHLIPCHSLLLLPSVFPRIRVFSSEAILRIRWPKY